MKLLIVALTALSLSLTLSACGKKGPLDPPPQSDDEKKKKTSD